MRIKTIYGLVGVICLLVASPVITWAQKPSWQVQVNDYQFSMSMVAMVHVDGIRLSNTNDLVGAFVGDQCRGVTQMTYVESEESYFAFLVVFANAGGENVSFRIYDSSKDRIVPVAKGVRFEIDGQFGNLFQSFSIAEPALNKEAEILDFEFSGIETVSKRLLDGQVHMDLPHNTDLKSLRAIFELSAGAQLYNGSFKLVSGQSPLDYSQTVKLLVLSEDQSVIKEWIIETKLMEGIASFYKKDAVCYAGGVIKVVYTTDGVPVYLEMNDSDVSSELIVNGEAIFTDLPVGVYKAKVGGWSKTIKIDLKQ